MPLEQKYLDLIANTIKMELSQEALDRFSRLYDCVVETNQKINITSLTSPIDVSLKHIIDSLTLYLHPEFLAAVKEKKTFCDIGCGGGFPGLPLACAYPNLSITMIDSTEKKILALKENAKILSLDGVTAISGRGEVLASVKGEKREQYDICVSRAVAALPVLCELCLPFVKPGGLFFAMKGQKATEEVRDARNAPSMLGAALEAVFEIPLALDGVSLDAFDPEEKEKIQDFFASSRYLIVMKKKKATQPQYPRKWAQMIKKPL